MVSQKILSLHQKLSALDEEKKGRLMSYLPEDTLEALQDEYIPENLLGIEFTIEKLAKRIDPSHFIPYLNSLDKNTKKFYISAFPKYKQALLLDEKSTYTSFSTQKFSNKVLFFLFKNALSNFPPPSIFPYHPLVEILSDNDIPLSMLIYYLGFIDFAVEIKSVVSRKTLKSLQKALTKQEIDFINQTCKDQSHIALKKMQLHAYNGNESTLKELIQQRGIIRFTQAIKAVPYAYLFLFTYFLPKNISDQINTLRKRSTSPIKNYQNWEEDCLNTWRFLCTYSP